MKSRLIIIVLLLSIIQGCAILNKAKVDPYRSMTEVELYEEGSVFLANLDISSALSVFEILEARYPFQNMLNNLFLI